MSRFGFGKKERMVVDKRELVGLEADLHENYQRLIARLQVEFNKDKGIRNKEGSIVKFSGGKTSFYPKAVSIEEDKAGRMVPGVKYVNLEFGVYRFVSGRERPSQLLKQYVSIVPVINNGTHRWAIDYGIQGRGGGVGMTSARKYNSLGDPALVYAVKQIVVKHSVGSFEEEESAGA